ncbi:hypothetical protein JVT61DRAFT_115 [Boletus reticuloceps]|uniref:C3H1-type domain-containing protein n=1 Tax=Boletus reticuloceps TaxID=495285 RepID=A0A8I3AFI0_9AGAM|nr:hypothetical protein JVT61DRAFT_115 [Boletus reticuloceps]
MSHTLMLPSALSLPGADGANDNAAEHVGLSAGQVQRFPHTRAQLSAIIRQHRPPLEGYDADDGDDTNRVGTTLVSRVASLLTDEQEDNLKDLLKSECGVDDDTLEQHVLDLMHRHRDDVAGVPFLFLTPTRRPSRPSSRASSHSVRLNRPDTPSSVPNSPFSLGFRRPHTPISSPLVSGNASSYITARSVSPMNSPVLVHSQATQVHAQFTASLPTSPISSPRLLSAKATEFKPIPRPLSAASSNPATLSGCCRTETPSPDLWSHSPLRISSNLAIAAPLLPDQNIPSRAVTPSQLRSSTTRVGEEEEEEDDPLTPSRRRRHPIRSTPSQSQILINGEDPDTAGYLTDGMTPLDVLSSVFGSTLAPSELEEALSHNGYDFEKAMAWLVDRALPSTPQHTQTRMQSMGGRVTLVTRDGPTGMLRGGRSGYTNLTRSPGRGTGVRPVPGGNRVCRYYLAGECLRADCRFSHDLERALCRFWLRGTCAKQDQCEFLHHLPKDVDVTTVTNALSRTNLYHNAGNQTGTSSPPPDEFPALGFDGRNKRSYGNWQHDPGRTRFAAAVKRPVPAPVADRAMVTRRDPLSSTTSADNLQLRTTIVAPKPSPRIKLHPPTLLPTLPTGESINTLYMSYRARALQLGAARNACLSRAADAWRRGDGAAAKRFSREGHDLNAKMSNEMTEAAERLVRERAKLAEQVVKNRDLNWSDDLGDRKRAGTCVRWRFGDMFGYCK